MRKVLRTRVMHAQLTAQMEARGCSMRRWMPACLPPRRCQSQSFPFLRRARHAAPSLAANGAPVSRVCAKPHGWRRSCGLQQLPVARRYGVTVFKHAPLRPRHRGHFARVGTRFWHCRVGGPGKFGGWRVAHRLLMGGPCRRGVRVDARRRGAPRGRKPEAGRLGPRGSRETMCSRYGLRVYGRRSLSSWARPTQLESVIGKAGHGVRLGVTATWLM